MEVEWKRLDRRNVKGPNLPFRLATRLLVAVTVLTSLGLWRPNVAPLHVTGRLAENSNVGSPVASPWWSGSTTVTLQWGCTTFTGEGTYIPPGFSCPPGVTHWHHGIDFADGPGQQAVNCQPPASGNPPGPGYTLYAARYGTVTKVDIPHPQRNDYTSDLQIQMVDGYYVNLLHVQSALSNLSPGSIVSPGEPIATVGDDGWPTYANACHLHFEIDSTNVIGDNGGFDVDPTQWLSSNDCLRSGIAPSAHTVPAVAGLNSNTHLFVRGVDGSLYHQQYTGATGGWTCFKGFMQGSPAAVTFGTNIFLFARKPDSSLRTLNGVDPAHAALGVVSPVPAQ